MARQSMLPSGLGSRNGQLNTMSRKRLEQRRGREAQGASSNSGSTKKEEEAGQGAGAQKEEEESEDQPERQVKASLQRPQGRSDKAGSHPLGKNMVKAT